MDPSRQAYIEDDDEEEEEVSYSTKLYTLVLHQQISQRINGSPLRALLTSTFGE
jgi:hypothetical protein